jgi:hypothetical protein
MCQHAPPQANVGPFPTEVYMDDKMWNRPNLFNGTVPSTANSHEHPPGPDTQTRKHAIHFTGFQQSIGRRDWSNRRYQCTVMPCSLCWLGLSAT